MIIEADLGFFVVAFLLGYFLNQICLCKLVEGQLGLQGGALPPASVMCSSQGFCGSTPPGYHGRDAAEQQLAKTTCATLCGP